MGKRREKETSGRRLGNEGPGKLTSQTAKAAKEWLNRGGVRTRYIESGSPGRMVIMRASMKLWDELLNGGIFYTLNETQLLRERGRQGYNTIRHPSVLGYKPPTPGGLTFHSGYSSTSSTTTSNF